MSQGTRRCGYRCARNDRVTSVLRRRSRRTTLARRSRSRRVSFPLYPLTIDDGPADRVDETFEVFPFVELDAFKTIEGTELVSPCELVSTLTRDMRWFGHGVLSDLKSGSRTFLYCDGELYGLCITKVQGSPHPPTIPSRVAHPSQGSRHPPENSPSARRSDGQRYFGLDPNLPYVLLRVQKAERVGILIS